MAKGSASAVRAGRAFVEIFADDTKLQKTLNRAQARLRSFAGAVGVVGRTLTQIGAIGGTPLAGIGIWALRSAARVEQLEVAFATMLGSAEKAKSVLADLEKFAVETPLSSDEIIQAARSLLAFGIEADNLVPTLRQIGDVSSGVGTPLTELAEIYGKAAVQGRLFAEDVNQLTGRGIPIIGELAKQFGVAESEVRGLVEQGKVGFPELRAAFETMTSAGGRFHRMMAAQAKTLSGLWSTLSDAFGVLGKVIGQELLPVAKRVTGVLLGLMDGIVSLVKNNQDLVRSIVIGAAVIGAGATAVLGLGIGLQVAGFALAGFAGAFGLAAKSVGLVLGAIKLFPAVVSAVFSPLGLLVAGIAAVGVAGFMWSGALRVAWEQLGVVWGNLGRTMMAVWGGVVERIQSGDLEGAGKVAFAGLRVAIAEVKNYFAQVWQTASKFFSDVWDNAVSNLATLFINGFAAIETAWVKTTSSMATIFEKTLGTVRSAWQTSTRFLAEEVLNIMSVFDDSIDVEASVKELDSIDSAERTKINARQSTSLADIETRRKAELDRIEGDRKGALASNEEIRSGLLDENQAAQDTALSGAKAELAKAKAELAEALAAGRTAGQALDDAGVAPLAAARARLPSMQQLSPARFAEAQDVRGEGLQSLLAAFGGGETSTDKATLETAQATKQMAETMAKVERHTDPSRNPIPTFRLA
jgi:tape measure domain-containing protein